MPEQDEMTLEELERQAIVLDELLLDFPLDIRSTYLWRTLKARGLVGCCCCCCCHGHHHAHGASTGASTGTGGGTAATPAPRITLTGMAFAFTFAGTGGTQARVEFEWDTTGGTGVTVDIEVRTVRQLGGFNWTPVSNLQNQPPDGRGTWWGFGLSGPGMSPGFHYQARAVAKENGVAVATSNIVTL